MLWYQVYIVIKTSVKFEVNIWKGLDIFSGWYLSSAFFSNFSLGAFSLTLGLLELMLYGEKQQAIVIILLDMQVWLLVDLIAFFWGHRERQGLEAWWDLG